MLIYVQFIHRISQFDFRHLNEDELDYNVGEQT